jgi:hypothetical protein
MDNPEVEGLNSYRKKASDSGYIQPEPVIAQEEELEEEQNAESEHNSQVSQEGPQD